MLHSWVTFGKHWDQDSEPSVALVAITFKALLGLAGIRRWKLAAMEPVRLAQGSFSHAQAPQLSLWALWIS